MRRHPSHRSPRSSMKALADIQVVPIGSGVSVPKEVQRAHAILEEAGRFDEAVDALTGFVTELASVVTLANSTADGLNLLDDYMFSTPNSSGLIIIGMNVTRTQNGFETGSLTMRLRPLVPTGTPDVVPD